MLRYKLQISFIYSNYKAQYISEKLFVNLRLMLRYKPLILFNIVKLWVHQIALGRPKFFEIVEKKKIKIFYKI